MTNLKISSATRFRNFRSLTLAAAITIYLLIVLGGIVRVTGSAGACPDWPTCLGQWTPPQTQSAIINYAHRFATLLAGPLVFAAAALAWKHYRSRAWLSTPTFIALGLVAVQIVLGAVVNLAAASGGAWLSMLHLAFSLLVQASLVIACVVAFFIHNVGNTEIPRLSWSSPFARLSLVTSGAVFILLLSGSIVAASGASAACAGWPLCTPTAPLGWLSLAHRGLVVLSALLVMGLLIQAWRTQRTQTAVLVSTTAAAVLFFAQALLGAKLVNDYPAYLLGLHQATAAAAWAALVIQATATGAARRTASDERAEASAFSGRKGLAKDLLMLTKPVVVALLLVTTYAGMVIGARAWPSAALVFWTLLGGFMAAGGSGAINQYIDREDDGKMQRTQKRPIPSGRLTPGEGLAFGVGMALASFFLMVAFVNFLAALLSLAGTIYYVLLYSIFLKKATAQNIVIGGGAGAIPPLVGWAATTGSLNIPAMLLFAVIFMWTPPHFWALALVRRNDYARAGVPMLPVVRGEKETRRQILIYTVELTALTLLLPVFGLGGSVYFIGALVLGGWLLSAAWKVWKQEGNKVAWKMYRYSSMYLAFIFLVLMVDRLL
jgi:protoheme IX farnesyltransferase